MSTISKITVGSTTYDIAVADTETLSATTTELNYCAGVTSNIQDQLDAKQDALTIDTLTTTTAELNYVAGVTSAIQTQLNNKNKKGYAGTITGDGSSTSFTVTHSLGTQDVIVQVYDLSTYATVIVDSTRTSTSVVTIEFNEAPTSGKTYRVLVLPISA